MAFDPASFIIYVSPCDDVAFDYIAWPFH